MASPAVKGGMTTENGLFARTATLDPGMIAAPRASDHVARAFRTAFGVKDVLPDDFRDLLSRLDDSEPHGG